VLVSSSNSLVLVLVSVEDPEDAHTLSPQKWRYFLGAA